jgi:mono/diheme cytochrome c family protein
MRTLRRLPLLRSATMLGALALPLAACGGGGDTPSTDTPAAGAPAAEPTTTVAGGPDGQALYGRCAACHQPDGAGLAGAFPPLSASEWVTGDPTIPIKVVLHGLQGEITVAGSTYNSVMLPYGGTGEMNDAEVAAVLTYVRSSFGNSASAVTADEVAAVRADNSGRTTPWTAEELLSRD